MHCKHCKLIITHFCPKLTTLLLLEKMYESGRELKQTITYLIYLLCTA